MPRKCYYTAMTSIGCLYRHRPKSALERGGTRSRPGTGMGMVDAIEETDENAPEPDLAHEPPKEESKDEVTLVCVALISFLFC